MVDEIIPYAGDIVTLSEARSSGLVRYFSGKPCKHGHIAERYTNKSSCCECDKRRVRPDDYRDKRRPYFRVYTAKWREENPDRWRELATASYAKHAEKRRQEKRDIRAKDPEKHRAQLRVSYQNNKAARAADAKAYRQAKPEIIQMHRRNRKARLRNADGTHSATDIGRLFQMQRGLCVACGVSLDLGMHVDHIIPIVRGGSNWPDNIQLLCPHCNVSKGAKLMSEWVAQKAYV